MSAPDLATILRAHAHDCVTGATIDHMEKAGQRLLQAYANLSDMARFPIPMRLHCPSCHALHVDAGEFAIKHHHTHACQHCGMVWRPAIGPTVGVQFLPGFKDGATP